MSPRYLFSLPWSPPLTSYLFGLSVPLSHSSGRLLERKLFIVDRSVLHWKYDIFLIHFEQDIQVISNSLTRTLSLTVIKTTNDNLAGTQTVDAVRATFILDEPELVYFNFFSLPRFPFLRIARPVESRPEFFISYLHWPQFLEYCGHKKVVIFRK